jgi:hypothetical protein
MTTPSSSSKPLLNRFKFIVGPNTGNAKERQNLSSSESKKYGDASKN